jgi:hypothetical protein
MNIVEAREEYECKADPCLLPALTIKRGEVHVSSTNQFEQKDDRGRTRSDLRRQRFRIRYHLVCFKDSGRASDDEQRGWFYASLDDLLEKLDPIKAARAREALMKQSKP